MALKGRLKFKMRMCIVSSLCVVTLLTIIYEIAAFCTLDEINLRQTVVQEAAVQPHSNVRKLDALKTAQDKHNLDTVHSDKVLHEFQGMEEADIDELVKSNVINTVHYVWCSNKSIEFSQFLGILSIWKILRPDILEFHHQFPLTSDKYNDWFEELQKLIPGFVAKPLPKHWDGEEKGCGFWFGLAVVDDRGGIFVANDIVLTKDILKLKEKEFSVVFMDKNSKAEPEVAVAMGNHHEHNLRQLIKHFGMDYDTTGHTVCSNIGNNPNQTDFGVCIVIESSIHPKDIWTMESHFGALTRNLLYGSKSFKRARPALPGYIPKIVHYVWFGTKEMSFIMYLSMLSTLFILNPDAVLIHGDGGLHGKYLDLAKRDKRVKIINRERPLHIFGKQVLYSQHRSDIVRAEVLLKYGGIYMDWDVLWLRNPDILIKKGYDAIANYDHMPQPGFPYTINLGVFMAKPKSTFVKRWQDALINYRSEDFLYNAVELPYKIYEKYPEYLHIEKRLQVMCFRLKCHPTFHPNFRSFMEDQPFDWKVDVYSIHFTYPDPPEFQSAESCKNGTGRFAEMGKFILQHENKLTKL